MRTAVASILAGSLLLAQNDPRLFRVDVRMVVLSFSVTDAKGRPAPGLKPGDIQVFENGVPQHIEAFVEGSQPAAGAGVSVYILFNTSNRMYTVFPYVYDAISQFVRRLDPADAVAIYTFSRNLSRVAPLTSDHERARADLSKAVAGDDTALFNCLLLTLRDAAKIPGRKAIVVFTNGADNVSTIGPDDVARVAEDEGIPIYVISTEIAANDPPLAHALRAVTDRSGGKVYWTTRWQDHMPAFQSVREDIRTTYTAYYYPEPDSALGFRRIEVKVTSRDGKECRVRVRPGYEARIHPTTAER